MSKCRDCERCQFECEAKACTCRAVLGRFPMRAVSACRARARRRRYMRKTEAEYIQLEDVFLSEPLEGPHLFQLGAALESLSLDGVGVIPTDTQHAFVTAISSKTGTQRIYDIKGVATDQRKPLSLLCSDLSMASHYCDMTAIPRRWFQAMKSCLPGPYTFILRASAAVPRVVLEHKAHLKIWKRREVGIRIPNNSIVSQMVEDLAEPLLASSAPANAFEIWEQDRSKLDFVVGVEALDAPNDLDRVSTVLDLTMEEPVLRRQGAGDVSIFEDVIEATVFQS
ncbi:unnamed protein product [Durusdinium trenchii]|uniref:Threonylcarbamoyl-AMP synthase n=1 Tax=Durusdinium trenchii TaxID=1381693 RepID=A0ABP0RSC2_9DINO